MKGKKNITSKKPAIKRYNNKWTTLFILPVALLMIVNSLNSRTNFKEGEKKDKAEQKKSDLIFLPVIFYSPETKIAGGAGGIYTFRSSKKELKTRPSYIQMLLYYTQNKQFWIEVIPDLYLKNEEYHLMGSACFTKFLDKFYGIGNNTSKEMEEKYMSFISRLNIFLLKKVSLNLNVGLGFEFEHNNIIEVEKDGQLAKGEILGSEDGTSSGLSLILNLDNRDSIFFPTRGNFYQFSVKLFNHLSGSDYNFYKFNLDFRKYLSLFSSHVLALQGYIDVAVGDSPLQMLSRLGGQNIMRGYYSGRYRDKNMIAFQMEYRMPVWWRLGLAAFIGFGDVSDKLSNFSFGSIKPTVGFGIRYKINREEGLNVRLDIGFSKESSGVYFNLSEAF